MFALKRNKLSQDLRYRSCAIHDVKTQWGNGHATSTVRGKRSFERFVFSSKLQKSFFFFSSTLRLELIIDQIYCLNIWPLNFFIGGWTRSPSMGVAFISREKFGILSPPPLHLSHPVHVTASNGFERSLRMRYHKTSQSDTMVNLMNLFFYAKKLYKYHNNMTMKSTKPAHI